MSTLLSAFEQHVESNRSPRTARTYAAIAAAFLRAFSNRLEPATPDVNSFLERRTQQGARRAGSTRNQELAALRALSRFARAHGDWKHDPTASIPFVREPQREPSVLTLGELQRFFRAAHGYASAWMRARNLAILALLSQIGLRVHELVALNIDQIDMASATLVAVRGKGGTIHDLPLNSATTRLLDAWLIERSAAAPSAPALVISRAGERLSTRAIQRLLRSLCRMAGTAKHVTPHTLRHSFATASLTLGADLFVVSGLLRHRSIETTARYLHLADQRRRSAVDRLAISIPDDVLAASGDQHRDHAAETPATPKKRAPRLDVAQYRLDDDGRHAA